MEHRPGCCHNRPVLPFCYSILLRSIRNRQLSLNPLLCTECAELLGGILTPIVRPQHPDLSTCLLLHKGFEPLEDSQYKLRLLAPQEVDPGLPGVVIYEADIVLEACQRT